MTTDIISPSDKKPMFRRSYETNQLVDVLNKLKPGDSITYKQLTDAAGEEINGATPALASARRIVLNELGYVIEPIWGVGMKRLTDEEIVQSASGGTKRISRRARHEADKLSKSDFTTLDDESRKKYAVHASVFGAIAAISSGKGLRTIEQNVVGETRELPLKETLALFSDRKD
jgi:hypothetical protein